MTKIQGPLLVLAALALLVFSAPAMAADGAEENLSPSALTVQVNQAHDGGTLVVSGPGGRVLTSNFKAGEAAVLPLSTTEGVLPDGSYTWSLRANPVVTRSQQALLDELRASGDQERLIKLREAGQLPVGIVTSGSFSIREGLPVDESLVEAGGIAAGSSRTNSDFLAEESNSGVLADAAQVIVNDLVVQGSTCVGQDCVNGESFGFDTLRLKENNLRIHFQDTSNSASFPTTDWRLEANDTSNGGKNRFSIVDATTGRQSFTVEGGAPANSLYVEDGGRIGVGTATPVVQMHIVDGNTPTLRLEQDGSSGFTPQTWDLAGNEANFFIRDATNGSQLVFRVFPNAGADLMSLKDRRVGVGTTSPSELLHLRGTGNNAQILIEDASAAGSNNVLLRATSTAGNVQTEYVPNLGVAWRMNFRNADLQIDSREDNDNEFVLTTAGDLTISGMLSSSSDRNAKQDIVPVEATDVLTKIAEMPVSTWSYKANTDGVRHIGPMAQDFYAAFGFGPDDKHISPQDTASVALVGVQAVNERLENEVEALQAANAALLERLEALEARLSE